LAHRRSRAPTTDSITTRNAEPMKKLRPTLALTAVLLLAAACGGTAVRPVDPSSPANAPAATQPGAGVQADGGAPAGADADDAAGGGLPVPQGATNMTITGARDFTVTSPGTCTISQLLGTDDFSVSFETDGDDFWLLSLDVRNYAGPGEYEIVDSEIVGKAFAHITDMMGGSSDSVDGMLTIGADGSSGSVQAELDGDAGAMTLNGSFDCEMA
jgi:hypothetical protein